MADAEAQKLEFEHAVTDVQDAIADLSAQITDTKIDDEDSVFALETTIAMTDYCVEKLENLRPTKKNSVISFADALTPISKARKTLIKARLLCRKAESADFNKNTVPQPPPTITAQRNIPEVQITKFNGDVTAYQAFIAAFQLKYDALPITPREKLQHLKECVTGNPLRAIRTLDLVDTNYQVALDAFEKQYNKPDDVVDELWNRLTAMPKSGNSNDDLAATYHEVEGILAALTSHGHSLDVFAPLRKKVYQRYPDWVVNTLCTKKLLPILEFQEGVSNIISNRTTLQLNNTSRAAYQSGGGKKGNKNQKPKDSETAAAPGVTTKNNEKKENDKSIPPCVFCSAVHYSDKCTKYGTLTERLEIVKGRCQFCFRRGHATEKCMKQIFCFHCRKTKAHHSALCPEKHGTPSSTSSTPMPTATEEEKKVIAFAKSHKGSHTTTMVTITNPVTKKSTQIRALFDNGASETYITEDTARRLGLEMLKPRTIPISTFGDPIRVRTATTTFQISNGSDFHLDIVGETMPKLPQAVNLFSYEEFRKTFPQFAETSLLEQGRTHKIELLVGADYYFDILKPEKRITVHEGLFLFATAFGTMLVGRTATEKPPAMKNSYFTMTPEQAINKLSSLDVLGIADVPMSTIKEEENALSQFYANIQLIDNRYQIRWPWREFPPPLTNNFSLALAVLKSQQRKLTDEIFAAYDQILQQQLDSGIIEEITVTDPYEPDVYYLPHHPVIDLTKTTPVRIVFNGAAKQTGAKFAINEVIYKGLDLLSNTVGIILRTLLKAILAVGDMEKAFHQLGIDPRDRNYVRFLWLKDRRKPASGWNLRFLRFLRVAFGIVASPFLLYATIRYHLKKIRNRTNAKFIDILLKALYADNITAGFDDEEEAIDFYRWVVAIFALISINVRSWASNSAKLRDQFKQPQKSDSISILGILWDQYNDFYSLKPVQRQEECTLRSILSTVSSLYDPCGWTAPVLTTAKLFLRTLHDSHYDWDDPLSVPHAEQWDVLQNTIIAASKISFPRYQFSDNDDQSTYELHAFSDASAVAFAGVVYLRKVTQESSQVAFLVAKTRIVPRAPKLSIPKLELLAAVLVSQQINFIRTELKTVKLTTTYQWTDSKCVLAWINNNKILPVYIQRRVDTVRSVPDVHYRYVQSEQNPADLPSRGGDEQTLVAFREGPSWLRNNSDWPVQPEEDIDVSEITLNYEKKGKLIAVASRRTPPAPFSIDPVKFSSYMRLLRITAYAMRFVAKFKRSREKKIFENSSIYAAERLWIQHEQQKEFFELFEALKQQKTHDTIKKLNVYADSSNILRCGGRFQLAPLSADERRPILLPQPKKSYFVTLLIEYYHKLTFHAGTTRTLHAIRRKFWIIAGRRAIYHIVRRCTHCKKFTARPLPQPTVSDLPDLRLNENAPFTHVGTDIFGPIYAKSIKYYILIVTDLVIRAIDLELLLDMTSEEISLALKRIFARRRTPNEILSDNAPQFVQLSKEFGREFTHDFQWHFIPAHSPWMGGAYERLIGVVKNCLSRTFYRENLSQSALRTALAEIAAAMNSRPLTYVSAELDDEPLTPNHFLQLPIVENQLEEVEITDTQIRSFLRHASELRNKFWNAWRSHYLQYLRNQYVRYNFPRKTTVYEPRIGDIVIIATKLQKRNKWPMGKIVQLNAGRDNVIRSAKIQTKNGILIRPLLELFPLELHTNVTPPDNLPPADDWDEFDVEETVVDDD